MTGEGHRCPSGQAAINRRFGERPWCVTTERVAADGISRSSARNRFSPDLVGVTADTLAGPM